MTADALIRIFARIVCEARVLTSAEQAVLLMRLGLTVEDLVP